MVEREEISNGQPQPLGNLLSGLEGRCVPATLDQAQKVLRYVERFGKLFLCRPALRPDLSQMPAEFLFEGSHLSGISKQQSPVASLRPPPNGITGDRTG